MSQLRAVQARCLALAAATLAVCFIVVPVDTATPPENATQLAITLVNGGNVPTANAAFSVVVESQFSNGTAANLSNSTTVALSLGNGTGMLGGTLTGVIGIGQSQVTINGVRYSKAESSVRLTASATNGTVLTAGTSGNFTVNPAPPPPPGTPVPGSVAQYLLTATSKSVIAGANGTITIDAVDVNGDPVAGASSVEIFGRTFDNGDDNSHVEIDADQDGTYGDTEIDVSSGSASFNFRNTTTESFRISVTDWTWEGLSPVLTTYPLATAGQVIITEFRLRGPAGEKDEYVVFYNNTNSAILVGNDPADNISNGWALVAADGVKRFTIPKGTLLPARSYYLATNNDTDGFSLSTYPTSTPSTPVNSGDIQYQLDFPSSGIEAGMALFSAEVNLDPANRLDAVGYASVPALYREGSGLPESGGEQSNDFEWAFFRNLTTGVPKDTNSNAADFVGVEMGAASNGLGQRLGNPGPRSTASPLRRTTTIPVVAIPGVAATVRDNRPYDAPPGFVDFPIGILSVPKRFTNLTGQAITRLRIRIVDMTTFPQPGGTADLRVLDATGTVTNSAGATVTSGLQPMLTETPSPDFGGGLNSTLYLDVSSLPGGNLGIGQSVDVHILLGVAQTGSFRFFFTVEALP